MYTLKHHFQTKKILEISKKNFSSLSAASGSIISPIFNLWKVHISAQSTNNFEQENNLQWCLDLSGPTLRKEITCAMLAYG